MKCGCKPGYTGILVAFSMLWVSLVFLSFHQKSLALFQAYARSRSKNVVDRIGLAIMGKIPSHFAAANVTLLSQHAQERKSQKVVYSFRVADMNVYRMECSIEPCNDTTIFLKTHIFKEKKAYAVMQHTVTLQQNTSRVSSYEVRLL